jgi:hypothetical protein
MWIAGLIGLLMMNAVRRYPEDGSAFKRQGAAYCENILKPQRQAIRPVGVQPMVAKADSEPGSKPVQKDRFKEDTPAEEEKCGDRANMKKAENNGRSPVNLV